MEDRIRNNSLRMGQVVAVLKESQRKLSQTIIRVPRKPMDLQVKGPENGPHQVVYNSHSIKNRTGIETDVNHEKVGSRDF